MRSASPITSPISSGPSCGTLVPPDDREGRHRDHGQDRAEHGERARALTAGHGGEREEDEASDVEHGQARHVQAAVALVTGLDAQGVRLDAREVGVPALSLNERGLHVVRAPGAGEIARQTQLA